MCLLVMVLMTEGGRTNLFSLFYFVGFLAIMSIKCTLEGEVEYESL